MERSGWSRTLLVTGLLAGTTWAQGGTSASALGDARSLVGAGSPAVAFSASVTHGVGTLEVSFTDQSTPVPEAWLWEFGDGAIATEQHPTHTYDAAQPGYDVSLTVTVQGQQAQRVEPQLIAMAKAPFAGPFELHPDDAVRIRVADMDGDGDLDVIAALSIGAGSQLGWWRNVDGLAQFALAELFVGLPVPGQFEPADLDGDGDPDLVGVGLQDAFWLENTDGAGALALQDTIDTVGSAALMLGDVDGDGAVDLATCQSAGSTFWYRNTDGQASFGGPHSLGFTPGPTKVHGLQGVDLDQDGHLDVASFGALPFGVGWSENVQGDGLQFDLQPLVADDVDRFGFADVSGNGHLDLVTLGGATDLTWYEHLDGAGCLGPAQVLPDGHTHIGFLELADLDLDGDADLLASRSPEGLLMWEQVDAPAAFEGPIRIAGDGVPGVAIQVGVPGRIALGGLDGDGDLDPVLSGTGDALTLLRNDLGGDWTKLGPPVLGAAGHPRLRAYGDLTAGGLVTLVLEGVSSGASTWLVLGATLLDAPFKGGVLVPLPEVVVPLTAATNGVHVLHATWPCGIPAGLEVYAQHWLVDGAAVQGFAASNGVVSTSR